MIESCRVEAGAALHDVNDRGRRFIKAVRWAVFCCVSRGTPPKDRVRGGVGARLRRAPTPHLPQVFEKQKGNRMKKENIMEVLNGIMKGDDWSLTELEEGLILLQRKSNKARGSFTNLRSV